MNKKEISLIRKQLDKTQKQMAQLLGISIKSLQSFEQGWRKVPVHIERQSLLLLALKNSGNEKHKPCWVIKKCPKDVKQACPAWEFKAGHLCWCINGTICKGNVQGSWLQKMKICRKCDVFGSMLA